jgi:hypothetical protein
MKKEKVIYSLSEEDIQTVSLQELGRNLSSEEIQKLVPFIEKRINWFDAIVDSINESIESDNSGLA